MNILRTSLLVVAATALAGVYYGAPHINHDLAPEPSPVTVMPPTVAAGAARVAVAEPATEVMLGMASLDMYGPSVDLTDEETRAMISRWRQLQIGSVADPALPRPALKIDKNKRYRPYQEPPRRVIRKLEDRYRERGFYAQSRWGQRGAVATDRTPTGRASIFSRSRWAKSRGGIYQRVGNRLIRRTNKRTTNY